MPKRRKRGMKKVSKKQPAEEGTAPVELKKEPVDAAVEIELPDKDGIIGYLVPESNSSILTLNSYLLFNDIILVFQELNIVPYEIVGGNERILVANMINEVVEKGLITSNPVPGEPADEWLKTLLDNVDMSAINSRELSWTVSSFTAHVLIQAGRAIMYCDPLWEYIIDNKLVNNDESGQLCRELDEKQYPLLVETINRIPLGSCSTKSVLTVAITILLLKLSVCAKARQIIFSRAIAKGLSLHKVLVPELNHQCQILFRAYLQFRKLGFLPVDGHVHADFILYKGEFSWYKAMEDFEEGTTRRSIGFYSRVCSNDKVKIVEAINFMRLATILGSAMFMLPDEDTYLDAKEVKIQKLTWDDTLY